MTRPEQLADAMLAIAKANHYMVGLTESVTWSEVCEAQQILITAQNRLSLQRGAVYRRYNLALDLLEIVERQV